jgi:hypothetical protein
MTAHSQRDIFVLHCCAQGLKRPELRDELYMQLVKQTRGNPSPSSRAKAWGLFNLVAASMPPSKDFTGLISEYVHSALQVGTCDPVCGFLPQQSMCNTCCYVPCYRTLQCMQLALAVVHVSVVVPSRQ